MFPQLPELPSLSSRSAGQSFSFTLPNLTGPPAGGSPIIGGFPAPGTISIGGSNSGVTVGGSSGKTTGSTGIIGGVAGALSSVLGIPAINWGRLAAFLLGLLLIAIGLYLIKEVKQAVHVTVKNVAKAGEIAGEAAA